jgi:hypothetical protein
LELERLAGRSPSDRRHDAAFPGDIYSPPLTIEVKAFGGNARGMDLLVESAQVRAAEHDPDFVLDVVDNVAQGDWKLFGHHRFQDDVLATLLASKREHVYYSVPISVAKFDKAPSHPSLDGGPVTPPDRLPLWVVPLSPTRISNTAVRTAAGIVPVVTARLEFARWPGPKLTWQETYGKTPIVGPDGGRTCAEVAIVSSLRATGWNAFWIDTFGQAPAVWRPFIATPANLADPVRSIFETVEYSLGNVKGGRWDIVAWKGAEVAFIESKGSGDSIRSSQVAWLERAVGSGALRPDQFGIANYVVKL